MCASDGDKAAPRVWFASGLCRKVGNGKNTPFWHQAWFGEKPLKDEFPRMFSLSNDKNSVISSFGWWDGDVWRWRWSWRRALFVWEEEIEKRFCDTLVGAVINRKEEMIMQTTTFCIEVCLEERS